MTGWDAVVVCAAFFVVGYLSCALLTVVFRDKILYRHIDRCEQDIYAPFLSAQETAKPRRGRHARPGPPPPAAEPPAGAGPAGIRLDAFDKRGN